MLITCGAWVRRMNVPSLQAVDQTAWKSHPTLYDVPLNRLEVLIRHAFWRVLRVKDGVQGDDYVRDVSGSNKGLSL